MVLDARNLSHRPVNDLALLEGLPAHVAVLGALRVRGRSATIASAMSSVPPHSYQEFGFRSSWEGAYSDIRLGIGEIAVELSQGLAQVADAEDSLTPDVLEELRTSGIPGSLSVYEVMCKAADTRSGAERARLYQKAISLDPHCAGAYAGLGTHLAQNGQLPAAIDCFRKQAELAPSDYEAYSSLGTAYSEMGRFEEALNALRQATMLYPQGDPAVFSNLGGVYHRMGKFDEAIVQYKASLEINPLDPDVHFNTGKLCLARGGPADRAQAREWLEKAASLYGEAYHGKRARVVEMLNSLATR